MPPITDRSAYAIATMGWWHSLQPAWRQASNLKGKGVMPKGIYVGDGGWGELATEGPNGLFIVLMTLSWWGLGDGGAGSSKWNTICTDVRKVFESLTMLGVKRGSGDSSGDEEEEEEPERRCSKR